ncbi:MAG: hypothetical protein K0R51_254 [Cytophagaceae bacterium]|jgi:hypothetical protein|nr:hypothetical protein [Cytophagaceae bacterium]
MLTVLCLFLVASCKCKRGCEGLDSKTEQLLTPAIKTSILGFPADTHWVFKRVSADVTNNDRDTIFLSAQEIYPLEKGDCAVMDKGKCCSDYYYEKSNRNLDVHSTTTWNHFNSYFTDAEGFWMKGSWGNILILNRIYSQDFLQRFNQSLTLTISSKLISDTKSGEEYRDSITPYIVHWSKQYGLVKYAYRTSTDTIAYERIDIP